VNISVSPFCTKLFQTARFFLNASVLFLSAKIFVQNLDINLIQMARYIRQIRKLTHSHCIIESSFLLQFVLFLPWAQERGERTRRLDRQLTSVGRRCSYRESILSQCFE